MTVLSSVPGAAMEKSYMSMFLLLVAISCALAKDVGKKETKETVGKETKETVARPKLPQTLSRGKKTNKQTRPKLKKKKCNLLNCLLPCYSNTFALLQLLPQIYFLVLPSMHFPADLKSAAAGRVRTGGRWSRL